MSLAKRGGGGGGGGGGGDDGKRGMRDSRRTWSEMKVGESTLKEEEEEKIEKRRKEGEGAACSALRCAYHVSRTRRVSTAAVMVGARMNCYSYICMKV